MGQHRNNNASDFIARMERQRTRERRVKLFSCFSLWALLHMHLPGVYWAINNVDKKNSNEVGTGRLVLLFERSGWFM